MGSISPERGHGFRFSGVFLNPRIICHPPTRKPGEVLQRLPGSARFMRTPVGSMSPTMGHILSVTGVYWNPQIF
jgi:hypothetical protein